MKKNTSKGSKSRRTKDNVTQASGSPKQQEDTMITGGMINHMTADGDSRGFEDSVNSANGSLDTKSGVPISVVRTNGSDPFSMDVLLDVEEYPPTTCCKKTRNLIAFATVVWLFQVILAVSLKKYGYIEQDLNELVAERILPQLHKHLEQSMTTWSTFNETSSWYYRLNSSISMGYLMQERQRPGFQLAKEGARGQYPVVMIPGFVTSGLEVWGGKECARNYFRQRMWGGVGSARQLLMERDCVLQHLALDPLTGGDPEGIRLRAAQGFEAADYFMANYWVWGKVLENMADMGYDASTMTLESYDWRLAFPVLEARDGYLTKLKYKIEAFHKASNKKVIITSHSLGAILVNYFFAWVTTSEEDGGGGGGANWVDEHIHAYVNIAGALLGVPKAATALLSGEMSDTIFMGTAGNLVEQFLGKRMRMDLWSTWGSLWSMLPKGGDSLWDVGGDIDSPIPYGTDSSVGEQVADGRTPLIRMRSIKEQNTTDGLDEPTCPKQDWMGAMDESLINGALKTFSSRASHSTTEVVDFLLNWGSGFGSSLANVKLHSFDEGEEPSNKTWHDLTRTPLPYAPNMKIYCLYGVGLDTERSYYYKRNVGDNQNGVDNRSQAPSRSSADPPFALDTTVEDPKNKIVHGVQYVDGDASVPLLSLGYMCVDAWKRADSGLNPSNIEVITREYKHRQEFSVDDPFRGPYSADHVDILGNVGMMEDFMKIISDHQLDTVTTNIISDIENVARRINEHPNGGLGLRRNMKKKKRRWPLFR